MLFKQAAVTLVLSLLIPGVVLADHVPTQTPYDISIACDADGDTTKGDITVTWQESDGFESSPPERYAIAFSNDNFVETNYAVANSTGWEEALSYKSYVFTASYRETIFGTTADTFYAKVRADNDTDASYSEWTSIVSIDCDYGSTPTTTTTSTTTTTTTTVPPKPEPEPEPYIPPPPPPPTPQEIIVDVKVEGVDKTYTQADVNDGTIERDQERVDNETEFGCFMTNAQIERGDCVIIIEEVEVFEDDIIKEEVINEEIKKDVEVIILKDDVDVLDTPQEEILEDEVVEFEEKPIEFEIIEFDLEDIAPEIVDEVPVLVEVVEDEPIKEDIPEVLEEDTPDTTLPPVEIKPEREKVVLTEEEVAVEVAEVVEIIKNIVIEEVTVEEVVEILEEVNDIGVQNLSSVTEETQDVIQEVVEEAIADVAELTEEQVEVVAEILQVETEDVAIIAIY